MKYLLNYDDFFEDGMGAVVSSDPGALPGTTGTEGSGDIGFVLKGDKDKNKKGDPSEVSDLRYLKKSKVNKIDDIDKTKD